MAEYSSMDEWIQMQISIYALQETEKGKYEGIESGTTAVRQGPFFGIFFNDGLDLWFYKEGHATLIDLMADDVDELRLLLCPWIKYMPKGPELPDDYYENPEYSEDPTDEEWDRWHELQRERERNGE